MMPINKNALRLGGRLTADSVPRMAWKCLFGGVCYGLMEVLWRGYTHPSMVVTGGLCFAMICEINARYARKSLLVRGAMCALGVTCAEFCVGMLVNRLLNMSVWDYSGEWLHLFGQICPLYIGLWFGLCTVLSFVLPKIRFRTISLNLQG